MTLRREKMRGGRSIGMTRIKIRRGYERRFIKRE